MKELFVTELYNKYPSLFSLKDNKTEPIGVYSIECDDGWFDILSNLCWMIAQQERNIEGNNKYLISQNREPVEYEPFRFTQIKEKFGGLRFYINEGSKEVYDRITEAEKLSYETCEVTGNPGKLRTDIGWYLTLCDEEYENKRDNKKY